MGRFSVIIYFLLSMIAGEYISHRQEQATPTQKNSGISSYHLQCSDTPEVVLVGKGGQMGSLKGKSIHEM